MAIEPGEIEREIRKFQEQFFPKIPPDMRETLERTTLDLVRSGIADRRTPS